ncbi:hypothetical protein [Reichenbachiella faecimaris]|nr:hypothetical protein [Reichenbachiella faecimaris]
MNKTLVLALLIGLVSCLSPDDMAVTSDPDAKALDHLLMSALTNQSHVQLKKVVELDSSIETSEIPFDTLIVKKDLKTLMEYSFARLIRSANYNKTSQEAGILYERKKKEKKGPVSIFINKNKNGVIHSMDVRFEEENYLYRSSQQIQLYFENNSLINYKIEGSRKLIGLDRSNYLIEVNIGNS